MQKKPHVLMSLSSLLFSAALMVSHTFAQAAPPDLTSAGVIAALKSNASYSSRPYTETYNLGATGLRGWIYIDGNNAGTDGLITAQSRQILVTVASVPGNAVLAMDDVILGAMAGSTGTVPTFTSDCRKALGVAIGNAEKTGAGTLRLKRWRAGATTDVNIPMVIMGNYTATAPYSCPKSTSVLANARMKLISELKTDPNFLNYGYGGAINGIALLASVSPGDADYAYVQTRLKSYADSLAANTLQPWGQEIWSWSYMSIYLSEYYLRTVADGVPDPSVLAGISRYTVAMAKGQSRYGTFSHGVTPPKFDGSLHGTVTPYGPINSAGIPANIAIAMGKKALVAGGQAIDPEIDPAIQRASDFLSYYMNKGGIPYGEHEPISTAHASNGKDAMCAVLFGLQANRPAETEYFARMSVAGCTGREYGHTGQGLSYLWGAMGANMGGPTAVAKYVENILWQLDLERRTDGSFSYGGGDQYGGGSTADGSYLGKCGYHDMNPTATFVLSYGVSLQRLYITGRNAIPANTLTVAKVNDAIAAATYRLDCPSFTTSRLLADLSAYDPVVRHWAATQLATRTLTATELNNLIASITNGTMSGIASTRMGACQALGARQATGALVALGQRLSDTDLWVRGKAAQALRSFPAATASSQRDTMLTAFATNATNPDVIVWNDPVQIANNYLSFALFGDSVYGAGWNHIADYTINAPKNLLYPAIKAGLKQPDSNPRLGVADFAKNYLTLADAQALTPDLFAVATTEALADTMWHGEARASGINAVAKYKPTEAISVALSMMDIPPGYGWGSHHFQIAALNVLSSFGDAARWTLPALRQRLQTWDTISPQYPVLISTIANIEAAIAAPSGMINLVAVATPQVVVTPVSTAKAITLTGTSPRGSLTYSNLSAPLNGTLTGTAPNLVYTPNAGYSGPDRFTFKVSDVLTTSEIGTVSIIVGSAGTGLKGEYFDNSNFTNLKLTRTDAQLDFDWGTNSPAPSMGADTFSVRWSGLLLVPETGNYTFSTLNSDGVRLFINGIPVVDDNVDHSTGWRDSAPVALTAGQKVSLQMEYYENTGSAVAKLKWRGPSLAGIAGSIIAKEWLYDGTGITNQMAYAHPQTVSAIQNTAQAITLSGSGAAQTPLTYSVVTQPLHGTLSGVAPNLIYTPAANYSGSDSFTFTVSNGYSNSAPATVSIGIWAASPMSYYWTNAVSGLWSGAYWSNAAGGAVTPAASGNLSYILNFDKPGIYTTTQNLNANFVLNQINTASSVTIDGSKGLSTTANGTLLPQINQVTTSNVVFKTPINLTAMTTVSGIRGGSIHMSSVISGSGGLKKEGGGTLQLYGLSPNPYSGGTIVNDGTLHLGFYDGTSPYCPNPVGTGPVTLNSGGTIQFDNVSANNPLIVNGGTLYPSNGWGVTWSGAITLNKNLTANAPFTLHCSGPISGMGGFTKVGAGPLVLSGNNSFTGPNQITAGSLQCNSATSLGVGPLNINIDAKVNLNYTGTRTIAALSYNGGASLLPGTYGSNTSPATNKNSTYFSGEGTITILEPPTTLIYDFNNGTLQGWNNRVWNGSSWIDLDPNATTYNGTWLPSSPLNGLFVPLNGAVWVSGNTDYHLNTLWLRSPQFYLNGTGNLIVQLAKGIAYGSAPANVSAVPPAAIEDGGWKGIAIRRVRDGVFVLSKARLGTKGDDYRPVTFTTAELASLDQNEAYTLELINSGRGGWGWLTMDNVSIPGSFTLPNRAPVALPQTVSTAGSAPRAITLSATDVNANPLVYSIVTFPQNGVITGIAPSVTYTATSGFTGLDTFTFKANDGILDSQVVTVTINVGVPGDVSALIGATAWGPNRVDTFVLGGDSALYWKFWNGSAWSAYSNLNATATAGIGVTNWGVNRLDIFYSGNNGSTRHKWYTGSWSAEEDLGGTFIGAPAATSWATNRIDLFGRGTDNRLYWKFFNGSWSAWTTPSTGADVYSSPAVTDWGANRLDVFYAGSDGSLRHKWYTGSWSGEENLGGTIVGGPSAVAWNNNRIDVIVRGTDNQLYWKYWNGSSWGGFNALGVSAYSDPAVSSRGDGQLDVFYKGANGAMKQKNYNLGSWSPEYDLGMPSGGIGASTTFASRTSSSTVEANSSPVVAASPAATGLPAPWTSGNIGSDMLSGSTSYNAGTASQSGSGALGSTSDKLNFSYQMLSGDGEIIAKISALQDTGTLSGVGVMIRETLATNSKHVFMGMSGANTYRTASRTTTGGIATSATSGTGTVPNTWIKLVRVGNVVTTSKSADGVIWVSVGSTTVIMATNCYIGLAVSSGSDTTLNASQFSNLSVTP